MYWMVLAPVSVGTFSATRQRQTGDDKMTKGGMFQGHSTGTTSGVHEREWQAVYQVCGVAVSMQTDRCDVHGQRRRPLVPNDMIAAHLLP